jgi:methyl-accepting chemotaxis protein
MKLNIQTKLLGGFLIAVALLVAVAGVGYNGITGVDSAATEIQRGASLDDGAMKMTIGLLEAMDVESRTLVLGYSDDLEADLQASIDGFDSGEDQIAEFGTVEHKVLLEELIMDHDAFIAAIRATIELERMGDHEAAVTNSVNVTDPILAEVGPQIAGIEEEVEAFADLAVMRAGETTSSSTTLMAAISVIAAVASVAIGFFLSRAISTGVRSVSAAAEELANEILPQLVAVTEAVAAGDLTKSSDVTIHAIDAKSADEVGDLARAFNSMGEQLGRLGAANIEMVGNLREIVGQVSITATDVSAASEQLASASEQAGSATQNIAEQAQGLTKGAVEQETAVGDTTESIKQLGSAIDQIAEGAQQQNKSVEATTSTVNEVSRAIADVAANAQEATEGSKLASDAAQKGLGIVEQTVTGMGQIKDAVSQVANRISDLGEQSAEIGKIVAVIDDIAAQTNLLALNAAIEAARAGEQGRGFAVVADEVRQLAERVTSATSEIAGLIEGVQKGVDESVKATEKGTEEVERGSELANEAGESLNEIQSAVQSVTDQVEQISAAAEDVTASSDEMVKSMESVSAVTEETTAATEQMAASNDQVQEAMGSISTITAETGASVEESSAATEELSSQVEDVVASAAALGDMATVLTSAVSRFNLDDDSNESELELAA